jgi:hypothetical protein
VSGEKGFLITTPDDDDIVFCCNVWSREIVDLADSKGFKTTELSGPKATRANVESHLKRPVVRFVMFNGHGTQDMITGTEKEVIVKAGENEALLQGKVVYARSCYTLDVLGAASVSAGADGYIGHSLPFAFVSDPTEGAHPLDDELAAPCLATSNIIPTTLLKGNSVSDAVNKSKSEMRKIMEQWETRTDRIEAPFVALCLNWNRLGLGFQGNGKARL